MKIEATRAKILAVCCMHIAIANNMSSMGLVTKATNAVKKTNKKGFFTCGNCTKCHAPADTTTQQRLDLSYMPED